MKRSYLLAVLLCGACARLVLASPDIPGAPQSRPIALVGGKVFPVSGPPIENATLLLDGGKIVAVGSDVAIPANAERVDVRGRSIYPGLIDANTHLGLVEVPTVRGSRDQSETGLINPNVKAEVAFNPDSELIPVARSGGVLTVLTVPSGPLINGLAACMQLDGWTWEDMCLKNQVGLHVNWPQIVAPESRSFDDERAATVNRESGLRALRQALTDARAYRAAKLAHAAGSGPQAPLDARWEAMLAVLEGKIRVFVSAEDIQQIQSAVALADQEKLRLVIIGGYDAPLCAALLKKHDIPVIVGGTQRLPRRRSEAYDTAFTVPARLHEAGVRYCIADPEGSSPSNVRNLPHHAGAAAAHGLPADEALKAITLYAAQILGVGDRIGSLEPGKDATLIVTDGDPLEIATHVTAAYIQGRAVSLNDRHKRLWEKYKEKYRRNGS